MPLIDENLLNGVIGISVGIFGYLGKKILHGYDRRIRKTEEAQDKILYSLSNVEKQIVRIATKLELMGK